MKSSRLFATFVFVLTLGIASIASAQIEIAPTPIRPHGPRHRPNMVREGNLWAVTAYRDAFNHTPIPFRQDLCYFYLGRQETHDIYAWVSTTIRWWGFAIQEADQVRQFGNYARVLTPVSVNPIPLDIPRRWHRFNWRGHSSMQFELVSRRRGPLVPRDMAAGHGNAYIEPGFRRFFGNTKMVRIGKCLPHIARQIKGVMETTGGFGSNGEVQVTDELVEVLKSATDLAPERQKNDGMPEVSPFSTDLAPLGILAE